jgi:hypothetical protein
LFEWLEYSESALPEIRRYRAKAVFPSSLAKTQDGGTVYHDLVSARKWSFEL